MLITRYGNEDVVVIVEKSKYGSKPNYSISLCEADDVSTIPEVKYEEIDDVVAILLQVKKEIEEDMIKEEEKIIAEEIKQKTEEIVDGTNN